MHAITRRHLIKLGLASGALMAAGTPASALVNIVVSGGNFNRFQPGNCRSWVNGNRVRIAHEKAAKPTDNVVAQARARVDFVRFGVVVLAESRIFDDDVASPCRARRKFGAAVFERDDHIFDVAVSLAV